MSSAAVGASRTRIEGGEKAVFSGILVPSRAGDQLNGIECVRPAVITKHRVVSGTLNRLIVQPYRVLLEASGTETGSRRSRSGKLSSNSSVRFLCRVDLSIDSVATWPLMAIDEHR